MIIDKENLILKIFIRRSFEFLFNLEIILVPHMGNPNSERTFPIVRKLKLAAKRPIPSGPKFLAKNIIDRKLKNLDIKSLLPRKKIF